MIFENEYKVQLAETRKDYNLCNKAILGYLEDIGSLHSDLVGYGPSDLERTKLTWLLADWKLQVIKRPHFKEKLLIKTWAGKAERCITYRDFEIYNQNNELVAKATSKWIFFNFETKKLERLTPEIYSLYNPEPEKLVFNEDKLEKLVQPENYIKSIDYTVRRSDIDINNHMHNLNYLDLAYEVLPEDVYNQEELNNVRISYKKEIKLGETVKCLYAYENNKHIVTIKDLEQKKIHAIIEIS